MDFKFWIIGQIFVDGLIFMLLVLILSFKYKGKNIARAQETIQKSEALLEEMQGIANKLEAILEEKKFLVQDLLNGLEREIKTAKSLCDEVGQLNKSYPVNLKRAKITEQANKEVPIKTIKKLVKKGMTKEEISKYLGLPAGEVDLILKLGPATKGNSSTKPI